MLATSKANTDINRHETVTNNHANDHTTIANYYNLNKQTLVDHANVLENHETARKPRTRNDTQCRNVKSKAGAANAALSALITWLQQRR